MGWKENKLLFFKGYLAALRLCPATDYPISFVSVRMSGCFLAPTTCQKIQSTLRPDNSMTRISRLGATAVTSLVVSAIFFAISAYNDFPISNQNSHFLHASVISGLTPGLIRDWAYKTTDPYPFATWITAIFLRFGPGGVYFLYFATVATFISTFIVFLNEHHPDGFASRFWSGLAILSALVFGRLTGLSQGVEGILGGFWQPSEAGVFLVMSVLLFASGRLIWSTVCAALAVNLHPAIIFGALILEIAASIRLTFERRRRELCILGVVFTLLVLPSVTYTVVKFVPTTSDLGVRASHILVSLVTTYPVPLMSTHNVLTIFMIVIAAYVCRKNERLSSVIFTSLILALIIFVIFSLLDDDRLLLLAPWRIVDVLAPISLILIVSVVLNGLPRKWIYYNQKLLYVPIILLAASVQFMKIYYDYPGFIPEYWIKATFSSGSYNWKVQDRLARMDVVNWAKRQDPTSMYLVPLNFEQFRLKSGRPTFVDWKFIPYKDIEVIEWKRRIEVAQKAFQTLKECKKIDSSEFNVMIVDDFSYDYKFDPSCTLYTEKRINSRFGFIRLK